MWNFGSSGTASITDISQLLAANELVEILRRLTAHGATLALELVSAAKAANRLNDNVLWDALAPAVGLSEPLATALANHLTQANGFDRAVSVLETHLAATPSSLTARATLAQILMHVGRVDDGVAALGQILARDPMNALAWHSVAAVATGQCSDPRNPQRMAETMAGLLHGADKSAGAAAKSPVAVAALSLLAPGERISVLDGGAREAHQDPRWRTLPASRLEFHGFEPDPPECERLNADLARMGIAGRYYPVGLWDRTGELPFHVNRAPGGSSFLDQNAELTNRWKLENAVDAKLARDVFVPERTSLERVVSVPDWSQEAGITHVDFCKLNVQGGELAILLGFGRLLDGVLGMLLEVAFVESYRDRPLFGDIDTFARRSGFVFFDLLAHHYVGRAASSFVARHAPGAEGQLSAQRSTWGQLIEGHALYLRDPIGAAGKTGGRPLSTTECIKLACIADVFGQTEYALELLDWLKGKTGTAGGRPTLEAIDNAIVEATQRLSRI